MSSKVTKGRRSGGIIPSGGPVKFRFTGAQVGDDPFPIHERFFDRRFSFPVFLISQ